MFVQKSCWPTSELDHIQHPTTYRITPSAIRFDHVARLETYELKIPTTSTKGLYIFFSAQTSDHPALNLYSVNWSNYCETDSRYLWLECTYGCFSEIKPCVSYQNGMFSSEEESIHFFILFG